MSVSLRIRTLSMAAVLGGGLVLSACGGGEGGASLRIDAIDIDYDSDIYEVNAGAVSIEFRNLGTQHRVSRRRRRAGFRGR
jgi:hypothetical protein